MRFAVLASGSKGNALVVQGGDTTLLVDCGLTPKALRGRLSHVGLELADLDALAITHAHGDHTKGAQRVAGSFRLRTYATRQTQRQMGSRGGLTNYVAIDPGRTEKVDDISLTAIALPHDAPGTVAFLVEADGARLGVCSDLGHPDPRVADGLRGCDALVLEFNHDVDMLQAGPYPPRLKRRVAGDLGHLSNEQAAELLAAAYTPSLRRVFLSHLSEVNNTPRHALDAAKGALAGTGVRLHVASQRDATGWFEIPPSGRAAKADAGTDGEITDAEFTEAGQGEAASLDDDEPRAHARRPRRPPAAAREHIKQSLRDTPVRPAPEAPRATVAVRRQLALFADTDATGGTP
jgi:phosphoribosyl 1,2-cyclic phosphodiesterase